MRPDLIFSYWIFAWFLLYEFNLTNYNPKFAITLGIIDNALLLFFMLKTATIRTILFFIIVNFFIKILPIYFVWKTHYTKKDIAFTVVLFIIYLMWTKLNAESIFNLVLDKNNMPGIMLLEKIYKFIK